MDASEVYPDVFGGALSYSSQRLAQLASLVTAASTVAAHRRAQANAGRASRDERSLSALRDQERAAWQQAKAGWAPAHDSRWLSQADLLQAARVWSAATAYAEADPVAGSAARKCEERLRTLHPYAMAWYDRLRSEGAAPFDAMHQAVPLFARAPHARPGDPAAQRQALEPDAARPAGVMDDSVLLPDTGHDVEFDVEKRGHLIAERLQSRAVAERGYALSSDELATALGATTTLPSEVIARLTVSQDQPVAGTASDHVPGARTAAQLAAESFPCTAADAVRAAAQVQPSPGQTMRAWNVRQLGRSATGNSLVLAQVHSIGRRAAESAGAHVYGLSHDRIGREALRGKLDRIMSV
jgi:hypothetical protein